MRAAIMAVLMLSGVARAQVADLGHRLPGGLGLDAGTQPDQGLYVADRFAWFASDRVYDRNGHRVPIDNLDIDAFANMFGVSGVLDLGGAYLGATVAVPIVQLSLSADRPEASVDRLGLGDVFASPLQIGVRGSRWDAVASYSFYAPTSQGERGGVGHPQWSDQLAAGGALFFDDRRGWRATALASYLVNRKKLGIDIERGDSIQVQGGVGGPVIDGVIVGAAGYAVWQVTDDRGSAIPPALRGARERVYGVGPEVDVVVRVIRSVLGARFEWDLDPRARPAGTILVVGLTAIAARRR